jgi:type IV pilus assembly protein PilW
MRRGHRQSGFSLLELMVATVIGLVASLAVFQTVSVSEERRRSTASGSEGLQDGVFGLASLERAVMNAGYNLMVISDTAYTSPVRLVTPGVGYILSGTNPPRPEFNVGCSFTVAGNTYRAAGVVATDGGGALASDTLILFSGSSSLVPLPAVAETGALAMGSNTVRLRSTYGFTVGDWVLVYEQNGAVNAGTTRPSACTLAQVQALPNAPAISPADITLSVPTAAMYVEPVVINLGRTPALEEYRVDANARLQVRNLITGAPAQVVADNVLSLQVQLGIDVGNDDVIDEWINPPAAAATWLNPPNPLPANQITALPVAAAPRGLHQIKAVRLGLLMRSPQFERPDSSGNCTTTPAGPYETLPAVAGVAASGLAAIPSSGAYTLAGDQRCFRYNTVSAVVGVRNAIMSEM